MALNVVLATQKQSSKGVLLTWSPMEGVASYQVFVASRKLTPEELEAAALLGGTDECAMVKLGADATAILDDATPEGETRFYGVAMNFSDGAPRGARVKMSGEGAPAGTPTLTSKGVKKQKASGAPAAAAPAATPAAAPAARPASIGAAPAAPAASASPASGTGSYRVGAPAAAAAPSSAGAASASPASGTGSYRVGAPAAAATPAAAPAPKPAAPAPAAEAPAPKPAAAAPARAPAPSPAPKTGSAPMKLPEPADLAALDSLSNTAFYRVASADLGVETVAKPAEVPLDEPLEFTMRGATQPWDGMRLYWSAAPGAAAYEIIVSDHQMFPDELGDALAGRLDFTSATAVGSSTTCVIDNITERESRGWYLILARDKQNRRSVVPFEFGDAAQSGKAVAPFANPNRTGALRGEVEGMLEEAKEQWARWKGEQDGGARREAKRLVDDALLIYPNHPGAKALQQQIG